MTVTSRGPGESEGMISVAATKVFCDERGLLLKYVPDRDATMPLELLARNGEYTLRRSLTFAASDFLECPDEESVYEEYVFLLGKAEGDYWRIPGRVLGADYDLHIGIECKPEMKWFVVQQVSVFRHIFAVVDVDFYIGGSRPSALSEKEFRALVDSFPFSRYEILLYANSRVEAAVGSFFSTHGDFRGRYQRYMDSKAVRRSRVVAFPDELGFGFAFNSTRGELYEEALSRLLAMVDGNARELDFQRVLPPYLELLFPQYVAFVQQVHIPDFGGSVRKPDYLMIDARGNVDVLEIKRPFDNEVMLASSMYRTSFIPARELSGAVMQCQKYVAFLLSGGAALEARLTDRLARDGRIPVDFSLRFVSPRGLVIMGRDPEVERMRDFDLIRRQYAGMVDVITYDDLIRRFRRIVEAINRKSDSEIDSAGIR